MKENSCWFGSSPWWTPHVYTEVSLLLILNFLWKPFPCAAIKKEHAYKANQTIVLRSMFVCEFRCWNRDFQTLAIFYHYSHECQDLKCSEADDTNSNLSPHVSRRSQEDLFLSYVCMYLFIYYFFIKLIPAFQQQMLVAIPNNRLRRNKLHQEFDSKNRAPILRTKERWRFLPPTLQTSIPLSCNMKLEMIWMCWHPRLWLPKQLKFGFCSVLNNLLCGNGKHLAAVSCLKPM